MSDPNQLVTEAVKQAPNLAVLAFVVFLFLKHLRSYNQMIRDINKENVAAREQSRVVIEENTSAVAQNTEVLRQIRSEIGYLKSRNKEA